MGGLSNGSGVKVVQHMIVPADHPTFPDNPKE